jgi:hypothetical protein
MTGQEARRRRPSQASSHDCSSTTQDSRRLGREPRANLKSLDPSLTKVDNRLNPPKLNTPRDAATATVGQGLSSLRAGAPAQPAPSDPLLSTWHTHGRSRDDSVSITSQPRAPLQFTQRVRRLGCDPDSSSGPPARRSRNQDPPQSTGPATSRHNLNLNGPPRPLYKFFGRPDIGPSSLKCSNQTRSQVSSKDSAGHIQAAKYW